MTNGKNQMEYLRNALKKEIKLAKEDNDPSWRDVHQENIRNLIIALKEEEKREKGE